MTSKIAIFCTTVLPVVMLLLGLLMLKYASLANILDMPALGVDLAGGGYAEYGSSVTVPYYQHSLSAAITLSGGEYSTMPLIADEVDLDLSAATAVFGGVDYDEGCPTSEWSPRPDRLPDFDRRHQPARRQRRPARRQQPGACPNPTRPGPRS